ncbi:MAG: alpha-N-acetylglucosaminidase [Verrucomicrobia bacterium]|nr:alpha-N-acetylglucosaminidase [Verrucomicrobiota bacterium]
MKHIIAIILLLAGAATARAATGQDQAAGALVRRVIPQQADQFVCEIIPAADGKDVFEVESLNGKIVLRGSTGVSIASAFNYYLKEFCHCQISWCGDQLNPPAVLPPVPAKVRVVCPHRYRVMFNYCTLSYSAAWWDWERWQRELDFLAMNGINTPLGMIGLEGVWYNTLLKHGFTDDEARSFLVGPGFFAWQWMTNIEGHGGPLPKHWIDERVKLGQRWMTRARELGMTPIQQGFSGNVPRLLKQKHPEAAIALQPSWCGFHGSAQLDPTDPLFKTLGRTFMEENIKLFGNGHLWAADPFHESEPPKPGAEYLDAVGKSIHGLMKAVDPRAVWAMQAWSIRKEIACAVPKGELLVLDLGGGRNDFWGHSFVKGQLHNFGGRINLHGDLRNVAGNPFAATAKNNPQCLGMGVFPEAIMQNPVFYDCVYDMIWRDAPANMDAWLRDYATRRYGAASDKADAAWQILLNDGPYKRGTSGVESSSMIAARPALFAKKSGPNDGFRIPYPPLKLLEAANLLLADAGKLGASQGYQYDVADLTRQILSNYAQVLHQEIRLAYLTKDKAAFAAKTAAFHQLLADVDTLLASRTEFLFGKVLADARALGATPAEAEQYAWNAAMQVTIWGPATDKAGEDIHIFDYSWREWSGLIREYYLPRWRKFHAMLAKSIDKGDYRDPAEQVYGRETLRANPFYSELADWEIAFTRNPPKTLRSKPVGDSITLAKQLIARYRPVLEATYAPETQQTLAAALADAASPLPAGAIRIGQWKSHEITTAGREITLDLTKAIKDDGDYEVTFTYQSGGQRLEIEWVALTCNGNEIMRDTHEAWAGEPSKNNTYQIKTGPMVFNGRYEICAKVKTAGGNDSNGIITLRKTSP